MSRSSSQSTRAALALSMLLLMPATAFAHAGHGAHGFAAGLLHPLTGIDHLVALIAVGWWSAATRTRQVWIVPFGFALALLAGAIFGIARAPSAATEAVIATSLILFGALLIARVRLAWPFALLLVLPLGAMHGVAHGNDVPPGETGSWLIGMVAATLVLHLCGVAAGSATRDRLRWATPLAGAVGLGAGGVLATALLLG
jgi:urease accessory protein